MRAEPEAYDPDAHRTVADMATDDEEELPDDPTALDEELITGGCMPACCGPGGAAAWAQLTALSRASLLSCILGAGALCPK